MSQDRDDAERIAEELRTFREAENGRDQIDETLRAYFRKYRPSDEEVLDRIVDICERGDSEELRNFLIATQESRRRVRKDLLCRVTCHYRASEATPRENTLVAYVALPAECKDDTARQMNEATRIIQGFYRSLHSLVVAEVEQLGAVFVDGVSYPRA